ncbi:Actin-like protein ARP9 [[Candida] zeylanoides]
MPLYREDNYLVVHPGSQSTIFSFGLQDSLSPPQYKIPTRVYQHAESREFRSTREAAAGADAPGEPAEAADAWTEVYPIQRGKIADLDAFNYLLKMILQSVIAKNPIITISQIPLLIISSNLTWSRHHTECVTKYVMESLEFPAFNVLDVSAAANFGLGVSTASCVVNLGHDNLQVMPVINYQSIKFAGKYLPSVGASWIDAELRRNLPHLSASQVDQLKKSGIYEVLLSDDGSFYSLADLQHTRDPHDDDAAAAGDDDDFDIAKLVAESDSTGDIVKKVEHDDDAVEAKPNTELEKNFFVDHDTNEKVWVGKERFQGTERLIGAVANAIHRAISKIPSPERRQECYDNLIFVGSTFKIPGFKRALLIRLITEYLVHAPSDANSTQNGVDANGVNAAILAYQQTGDTEDVEEAGFVSSQVPTSIKMVKMPDYFPEWKKPKEKGGSWEDVYFLGGEIYAKQIFGGNSNQNGEMFIDAEVYEEKGPQGIWDVTI